MTKYINKQTKKLHRSSNMKQRILGAAIDLIAKRGMDRVSVREIVAKVKVTKPVLYYYFKDKDDLCRQIFMQVTENLQAMIKKTCHANLSIENTIKEILKSHFILFKDNPKLTKIGIRALTSIGNESRFRFIIDEFRNSTKKYLFNNFLKAEQRREIPSGSSGDIIYLTGACIEHFMMNINYGDLQNLDDNMAGRYARIIILGIRAYNKKKAVQKK